MSLPPHASGGSYKALQAADCPGESCNKNRGDHIQNEGFSPRSITLAIGEAVSCRKAPVTLSSRDTCSTPALPRYRFTHVVLGTVGRALTSYTMTNTGSGGRVGSPCRYQAITFQNFNTVEVLNTICLEHSSVFFPINNSQGPPITHRVLIPIWNL